MKTVNEFIVELSALSDNKKELPIVIVAPNGLEFEPKAKMGGEFLHLGGAVDRIVISYE